MVSSLSQALQRRERDAAATSTARLSSVVDLVGELSTDAAADAATTQLVRSIVSNAERLGLVWKLRPSTVSVATTSGVTMVTIDGTTTPIRGMSLVGDLPVGARVMAVLTPPSGVHVVGFLGSHGGISTTVGGKQWASSGSAIASGLAGTEALTNMDTGIVSLSPLSRYRIMVRVVYIATTSAATTWWILRVRANSTTGTQYAEQVFTTANTTYGEERELTAALVPDSSAATNYVLTCQRLSGAATLDIHRGGPTNSAYMTVHRDCGTDLITLV